MIQSEDEKANHVSLMNMASDNNAFTGSVTIAENTRVTLSGKDAFCHASSFTNNGLLTFAADQTLNNLSGSGAIDVGEYKLTINNDQDSLITGAIVSEGEMSKK